MTRKNALLLPNMVEYHSGSMRRYADDLMAALVALDSPEWSFGALECHHVEAALQLLPGEQGRSMASRLGRFVRYPRLAAEAARNPATDVFHILDHSHANLIQSLPPAKTVITCHDIIPYLAAQGRIPVKVGRFVGATFPLRARAMKACRFVITVSECTKRDMVELFHFDPERIAVVYHGTKPEFQPGGDAVQATTARLRAVWGVPEGAKVILHVGTANRYKNAPALLHALQRLRNEPGLKSGLYLVRAGAPLFPDEQELAVELGVADRVLQIGRIPDDAGLAETYRAADVFAFPSLYEGFGWPPLEAMACGVPVVASNRASLPEVVGSGGITVDPMDREAFAQALLNVLTDERLSRELRVRALAQASKFTWKQCALDTLAVYQRIAGIS